MLDLREGLALARHPLPSRVFHGAREILRGQALRALAAENPVQQPCQRFDHGEEGFEEIVGLVDLRQHGY